MNVYDILFRMTRHCNSAPRVSGTEAGGQRGRGGDIFSLFSRSGFEFWYQGVS